MQNFTLGKKGYSMLLFALVLLIGSASSYGQCPTTAGTPASQEFCFLATVGEIDRDGTDTAVYQTADNANDTQAIPSSELLSDNTTYYVGGQSGTCTRVPVLVNIIAEDYPNNSLFPGENSFTISPCSSTFTAEELATYFTPITGYEIKVYEEEFGTSEATSFLTPNESYFVGQVYDGTTATSASGCPSLRVAVGYDPQPTPPPTAASPQTFCDGATVGDLEAQGTSPNTQSIRWYRSATSFQPLSNSTILINGATYYTTQVINDRNSPLPPCESETRTAVTVALTSPVDLGGPYMGIVCEDDVATIFPSIDEIRKYYIALLGTIVPDPSSGTLNPTAAELANIYAADADGLGDFTTTYTYGSGDCASSVELTARIIPAEDAEAGTIEDIDVPCGSSDIIILDDSILSPDASTGGTFSGTGVNSDGNFDPAVGPGTYVITYSVDDSADCVSSGTTDSTTFNINVGSGPSPSGETRAATVCIEDVDTTFPSIDEIRKFYLNLVSPGLEEGTLTPNASQLADMYAADSDGLGDFTSTYTNGSGPCASSIEITVSIVPTEDAEAGTINDIDVPCGSTDIVILDDSLVIDGSTGGTFSGTGVNSDGNFDPAVGPGTYVITYSVDDSADCVTDGTSDATTFNINVGSGTSPSGDTRAATVCIEDVDTTFPSVDEIRKFYLNLVSPGLEEGTLTPNASQLANMYAADADGLGDFTSTYTNGSDPCASSIEITVSIVPTEDAEAGTINDIDVSCENSDIVILDDSLVMDGSTGGTFSGTGVNSDGNFDPAVGPGTYVITYSVDDSADCVTDGTSDATTFNINVGNTTTSIGTPVETEMCITEVMALLADPSAAIDYFNNLASQVDPEFDGDFTVEPAVLGAQILNYISDPTTASQIFTTNYTYTNECGVVSTDISLTINNTTPADAGDITDFTLCENDERFNLFTRLTDDNPKGGTFSDESGVIEDGLFDISATGVYTITYTVSEEDIETCLSGSDSTEFDLTVTENTIVIGNPNVGIVCQADVQTLFPSVDEIRKYLINLLDPGVNQTSGTFNPTAAQLAQMYQNDTDGFGDFKTNYTIVDGTCSSSVELTIRILQSLDTPIAEASQSFCSADSPSVADLIITGDNIVLYEDEELTTLIDNTATLIDGEDYYAVAVSEDENICNSVPTKITVSIVTNAPAPEAEAEQNFCTANNPTVGDLVITGDNITVYEDADLTIEANSTDALVDGEDYYAVAFCGTDSTMITVNLGEAPTAPTADANQSFCLIDNPTVGDITVTGDNIVFYSDAELETVVDVTTALIDEAVYYAVANNDAATCSSDAVAITVAITDPAAPTLSSAEGDQFCRSDKPTVQDLINNFTGSGVIIYSSSTGGTPIAATTALQDGVTYYGASVNGTTSCESTERLAVVAKVEFCGIPEGFSPNGDGINDRFVIPDLAENFPNYTIEIFNRWGNVVFKGNASTGDWDGISNQSGTLGNDVLPVGVYFYILNYNDGQTSPVQGKLYLSI